MKKIITQTFVGLSLLTAAYLTQDLVSGEFSTNETPIIRVDADANDFILEYVTTAASQNVVLNFVGATNVTIDWADGSTPTTRTTSGEVTKTYTAAGTYQVLIDGSITGFGIGSSQFNYLTQSNNRLTRVVQWGDTGVVSLSGAFAFANNLVSIPSTLPSTVNNLSYLFRGKLTWTIPLTNIASWDVSNVTNFTGTFLGTTGFNTDISSWNTVAATSMNEMFSSALNFNQPIGSWDVSNVTNFSSMFYSASKFNQPLNNWNTSSATNMAAMFSRATIFNQPLSNWDVSNVTNFTEMFNIMNEFNQDISMWDVSGATSFYRMFWNAKKFNSPLNAWDVSNVTSFQEMFREASLFNQPLNNWNTASATSFQGMFYVASQFNQDISGWNVSNVTNFQDMFNNASNFNQPLNTWNVGRGTNFNSMFRTTIFDQPLNNWDVSKGLYFSGMFYNANFNQDISSWDVARGINFSEMFGFNTKFNQPLNTWNVGAGQYFSSMFRGTSLFNQPLSNWNTANALSMERMFDGALVFNQDISGWNTGKVTNMFSMFNGAKKFNQNLSSWDVSKVTQFGAMFSYTDDFNQPIGTWNTISAQSMSEMFLSAKAFNAYIGEWNVTNVTNFSGMFQSSIFNQDVGGWDTSSGQYFMAMFRSNEVFNQDISAWNTGNAIYMYDMFYDAKAFNSELNDWDTSKVTQMHRMFYGATVFNQPLNLWDVTKNQTTFGMFQYAVAFNQDLPWITTDLVNASDMFNGATAFNGEVSTFSMEKVLFADNFFRNATSFNQPIPAWNFLVINTSSGLERFFSGATAFDQDISGWNFSNVKNLRFFMDGVNLNPLSYDALLQTLINQNVSLNVYFNEKSAHFGISKYSKTAKTLKDQLIAERGWTIVDGGELTLTITVNDEEIYFGESDPEFSVSYNGLVTGAGEDSLNNAFIFTRTSGTIVGDYTVSVTGGDESYYYVSYATGTLSIIKPTIDVSGVSWNYTDAFTYSGNAFTVTLNDVPALITVTYTDNIATNAGTYTASVSISFDSSNYELVGTIAPLTWVINKATYDLSAVSWSNNGTAFTYDTTEKTVTLNGLPNGVSVVSYEGNTGTAPGTYTASVTLSYDINNYFPPTLADLTWEIIATDYTITFDTSGGSLIAPIIGIFASDVNAPADPTRVGYIFNGWSTEIPETMPNNDITIVASWLAINTNNLTVTDLNGIIDLSEYRGQDITVELIVELIETSDLSDEEIRILDAYLSENVGSSFDSIMYDIQLLLNVNDESISISETEAGFEVVLAVPEAFQDKELVIIQYINGVATTIEGIYDPTTHTIRFNVSQLGTYVLAYESFNINTTLAIGGSVIATGLLGWLFIFLFGKHRKQKKDLLVPTEDNVEEESMESVKFFSKPITIQQAFYETLSPTEQTEFKSLFVEDTSQHLVKELTYRIGEMNEAFFLDVYRYLYRYRKIISLDLLKKLTDYGLMLGAKQPQTQTLIYEAATKTAYARRKDPSFLEYAIQLTRKDIALQRDVLNPRNKFVYSFYRLSIILEKQKQIKEALVLVNEAIARQLNDKTKGGFAARKTRLQSK